MSTEQWALGVSIVALLFSIIIPIWQFRASTKNKIASKRTMLLQTILSTKSVNHLSLHELKYLINRFHSRMEDQQRKELKGLVARLKEIDEELENLHSEYSDYNDGATLQDIDETQAAADVAFSEAQGTAKLIENGQRSYEHT